MPNMIAGAVTLAASLLLTSAAQAQTSLPGAACPAGTHYTTIRHNIIKAGQLAAFEQAVAAHNAWYLANKNATTTTLARVLTRGGSGATALSTTEAVTLTRYADVPQPAHDAAYQAFTAKYRATADVQDEARVCMP